jgi:cellulose synthase/poly-beta-1,6-N-acetylglucosamine synthase-like glycosyltransferase
MLPACLYSLKSLDYPEDKLEIMVIDGGSSDDTQTLARKQGVTAILNTRVTVVSARNLGVTLAHGDLIAFTDADCVVGKDWLKNAVKYLADPEVAAVGGPNLVSQDDSAFAKAVGFVFDHGSYFKVAWPTRKLDKIIEAMPHGSNAIYKADVLRQVMPIDESVVEGEDVVMNGKIKRLGYKMLYAPDVVVYHHRRSTIKGWWNQMYRYGKSKEMIADHTPEMVNPMHYLMGWALPILLAFVVLMGLYYPHGLLASVAVVTLGLFSLYVYSWIKTCDPSVSLYVCLAVVILPLAWSCGYLREWLRQRPS